MTAAFIAIVLFFGTFANIQALEGSWFKAANMGISRSDMAGSTVNDDNSSYIIISGGCVGHQVCDAEYCSCQNITNLVEAYHPLNNSWITLPPMPRSRYRHASEILENTLYVFGGRYLNDSLIVEVDAYDISSNTWSTLPSSFNLVSWTSDFSSFVYKKAIWIVGGYDVNYKVVPESAYFEPSAGWHYNVIPSMNLARGDTCAVFYSDSIYVLGGFVDSDNFCKPVDTLEVFNFTVGNWYTGPPMPIAGGDRACGVFHSLLHTFGGEGKDNNCSIYSYPQSDVLSYSFASRAWSEESPMTESRFRFTAEYFNPGNQEETMYVFGGQGPLEEENGVKFYPTLYTVAGFRLTPLVTPTQVTPTPSPILTPNEMSSASHTLQTILQLFVVLFLVLVFL